VRSSRTTSPDGPSAELEAFAEKHRLPIVSIADLIRYRRRHEKLVKRIAEASLPTEHGQFQAYVFENVLDGEQHMALVYGDISTTPDVLVRVHSECLTGDVFGSMRCDCGPQLENGAREGRGRRRRRRRVLARSRGPRHRTRTQDPRVRPARGGPRTPFDANLELGLPVDSREYGVGAQISSTSASPRCG